MCGDSDKAATEGKNANEIREASNDQKEGIAVCREKVHNNEDSDTDKKCENNNTDDAKLAEDEETDRQQMNSNSEQEDAQEDVKSPNEDKGTGKTPMKEESVSDKKGEMRVLQCTSYRNFSRIPAPDTTGVVSIFKAASTREPTFPAKLHMILSNPEFEDVIAWMPHGRSWRILKPEVFENRVLPLFFSHCRLSSFMRQVNGWGLRRAKHGPDYNAYYNELFLRGLPHLVERMRRESVSSKSKGNQEDEPAPDFYKISEEHPLPEIPSVSEYWKTVSSCVQATPGNMAMLTDTAASSQVVTEMPDAMLGWMARSTPTQAEVMNAFRSARMMEQQRLAAINHFGSFPRGPPAAYGAMGDMSRMAMAPLGKLQQDPTMTSSPYGQFGGFGQGAVMPPNPYGGAVGLSPLQLRQGFIPGQFPNFNGGPTEAGDGGNYDFSNLQGYQLPRQP